MRVLACYATMDPRTKLALETYAPHAEIVYVGGGDEDYYEALKERWTGVEDLVNIEQDNEITAEVIPSLENCNRPWCTYAYPGPSGFGLLTSSLGCTKWSAALQRRFSFWELFPYSRYWEFLDMQMASTIQSQANLLPHVHGKIRHFHDYEANGDIGFKYGLDILFTGKPPKIRLNETYEEVPVLRPLERKRRWWKR